MKLKKTDQSIDQVVTRSPHPAGNEGGYNASLLPFHESATATTRNRISTEGEVLYVVLVKTGVRFFDEIINRVYDITEVEGAFGMLINDREFDVYQTAPQCTAAALIIAEIARQATISRKARKCSAGKAATFEMVLDAMDKIATAIGQLPYYQRFQLDVDMAAAAIFEKSDNVDQLFDATGKCNKHLLAPLAARLSVVRGEGQIQSFEVIKDAKPTHIVRAVRNSKMFYFSVGNVPIHDPKFMDSLVKHLEQQRQKAMKLH